MIECLEYYIRDVIEMIQIIFCSNALWGIKLQNRIHKFIVIIVLFFLHAVLSIKIFDLNFSFLLYMFSYWYLMDMETKPKNQMFWIAFCVVEGFQNCLYCLISKLAKIRINDITDFRAEGSNMIFGIPGLLIFVLLWLIMRNKQKSYTPMKKGNFAIVFVSLIFISLQLAFVSYILGDGEIVTIERTVGVGLFLMLGTATMMILSLFYISAVSKLEQARTAEVSARKKQEELLLYYNKKLYARTEAEKGIWHDMRHWFLLLREHLECGDIELAKECLEQVQRKYNKEGRVVYSQNQIIDAVIVGTLGEAIQFEQIQFDYSGKLPQNLTMDDLDLCSLIANVLENALEATLVSKEKPLIMMQVGLNGNIVSFIVENPVADEQKARSLKTEKEADSHGYGTKNIRKIAETYDGLVNFSVHDHVFRTEIILAMR